MNADELHKDAIVIDMTCPLARMTDTSIGSATAALQRLRRQ